MVLTQAPHRVMFFSGALQLLLSVLLWLLELVAQQRDGSLLRGDIPPAYLHALVMYLGVFPFFMFGFLLTAFPRWVNSRFQGRSWFVEAWILLSCGWLLVYAGALGKGVLITTGLLLCALGWLLVIWTLLRVFASRDGRATPYEAIVLGALALGWAMLVLALIGHALQRPVVLAAALDGALWLFLLPLAFTVSHRMIPFFSNLVIADYEAYQPRATLIAGVSAMLGYAIASQIVPDLSWLFALALAAVAGWLSVAWGINRSLSVRLLAMLHIAFAWLALAAVLFAVQGLTLQISGEHILGRAPLHAAGIGFLASLVIAFASRVSLGHSGRSLVADRLTWHCFLGFQTVAVLRVLADLPLAGMAWSYPLYTAAAVLWITAAMVWSAHYLPIYLTPRIDGRPG